MSTSRFVLSCFLALGLSVSAHAADSCRARASALGDAKAIAAVRGAIARQCPCGTFDGSSKEKRHGSFVKCANGVIAAAVSGPPLLGAFTLRRQCRNEVKKIYAGAACGFTEPRVMCCEAKPANGRTRAAARTAAQCVDSANGHVVRHACQASPFAVDACSVDAMNDCATLVVQDTVDVPSSAQPANTPGSPGVVVKNPTLLTHFAAGRFTLHNPR